MIKEFAKKDSRLINKIILSGTIVIFLLASLFHFSYELLGQTNIAAVFFPVNESIFEHLKLVLYPSIIFWLISYIILSKNHKIYFTKWVTAMTASILTAMIFIVSYYYVSHYAFEVSISILDVLSLLVGSFLGQLLGCHLNSRLKPNAVLCIICLIFIFLMCVYFANCTFYAPKLPLFKDPVNGGYGI